MSAARLAVGLVGQRRNKAGPAIATMHVDKTRLLEGRAARAGHWRASAHMTENSCGRPLAPRWLSLVVEWERRVSTLQCYTVEDGRSLTEHEKTPQCPAMQVRDAACLPVQCAVCATQLSWSSPQKPLHE